MYLKIKIFLHLHKKTNNHKMKKLVLFFIVKLQRKLFKWMEIINMKKLTR